MLILLALYILLFLILWNLFWTMTMITNIFPYFTLSKPKFTVPLELKYLTNPRRAYYMYKQEDAQNAPWVVLLHGWLLDSSKMNSRLVYYVQHGFNVLLLDARSHGKSQFVLDSNPLNYAKDAFEVIQYENIPSYIAHGVSYGALSALKLATMDFKNVGLILEAMPYSFPLLMKDLQKNIGILKYISYPAVFIITALRKKTMEKVEAKTLLQTIFVPAFIIIGENDPIVRKAQVKAYQALLPKLTWVSLWIVPNSDHTGMVKHFEYPFRLQEFLETILFYQDRMTLAKTLKQQDSKKIHPPLTLTAANKTTQTVIK